MSDNRVLEVAVRGAASADAGAIARVHFDSWRTTYSGILPGSVVHQGGSRTEAAWLRRLEAPAPGDATWIAERGGDIAGFAHCGEARHRLEGLEAEVYALYVVQRHQRAGAGRELVAACARHFVRNGWFGFYLWVLKANRARLFYETLGGREVACRSERLGRHSFDVIAYAWHDLTGLVAGRLK